MKKILGSMFAVMLLLIGVSAQKPDSSKPPEQKPAVAPEVKLPTAKEIIDKYVKALGGREALLKYKSRVETGTVEFSGMGLKGTFEAFSRSDDRALTRLVLEGVGEVVEGYDGTMAWSSNPMQGSRVKEGKELEQTKRLGSFAREANLDKVYATITVKGVEKVGDRNAYVLVGTTVGLPDETLYFDVENGLMLRRDSVTITPEGQMPTTTFLEDYREIGGIKTPYRTRSKSAAFEIVTVTTDVKFDVPIEDAKFKRPN